MNVRPYVDQKTLALIGDTLISSTIIYGAPVWGQTTKKNLEAVQAAQIRAARIVLRKHKWSKIRSHRQQMLDELGWRNVHQLISSASLNLIKAASEDLSAPSLNSLIKCSTSVHPRGDKSVRLDHTGKLSRPKSLFEVKTTAEFNILPPNLRSSKLNTNKFKVLLKEHMLSSYRLPTHNED